MPKQNKHKKNFSESEKIPLFISIHLVIISLSMAIPIAIPIAVSYLFNHFVDDANKNNYVIEITAFLCWFIISVILNHFLIKTLSCYIITTKKYADIYKNILSLIYFLCLTLMSFLVIDKLINQSDQQIATFIITLSFGSLSSIATFAFRNHK